MSPWRSVALDTLGIAGLLGALLILGATCGPSPAYAAIPAEPPVPGGPELKVQCAPLTGDTHICRTEYGTEVCYAVVAQLGGMASGDQAAISCISKEK